MISRFLLVKSGCPFCRDAVRAVSRVNMRLPIDRRIRIINCSNWEEYGLRDIPLLGKFEKEGFEGYPFLYMNGVIVEQAPTSEMLKILLESYLKKEFIF